MGIFQLSRLWTRKPQPPPDWQTTLCQRAELLSQLNQNLSSLAWQMSSPSKHAAKSSPCKSAACLVAQSVRQKLKSWLPNRLKTCCSKFNRRRRLPLKLRLNRLCLSVTTPCSKLLRRLMLRLLLRLMRFFLRKLVSWLLKRFLTDWMAARKFGLATNATRPALKNKPQPAMNQRWLSNLVTASSWLKVVSRLCGSSASCSSAPPKSCPKS